MSKKMFISGCASLFTLMMMTAEAATLIHADFNTDRVSGNPTASYLNKPAKTDVRVVGNDSTPPDPLGGEGNRSLLLDDAGSATAPDAGWATAGFVNEKRDMSLSMRTYFVNDSTFTNAYIIIQAGKNDLRAKSSLVASETAVQLTVMQDRIIARSGSVSVKVDQIPGTDFAWNSAWDVVITISPATRTWSATINGIPLTGRNKATFDFRNNPSVDGINFVSLVGFSSQTGSRVFADDIKLDVTDDSSPLTVGFLNMF